MMYQTKTITLYKDTNGNLWDYEGFDGKYHQMSVVEEDDGHYFGIGLMPFPFTNEEFATLTTIQVEV